MAQWDLEGCCGTQESVFLAFYAGYILIFILINSWTIMKPMRLLAVFVHEFGHASACWMTGGKVKKIEVYNNEGGITGYSGGMRCIVIPAGYVGAAFWGGAFVAMSGSRVGATVVASLILFALFISLFHDPNKTVVFISLGFGALLLFCIFIEWFVFQPFIEYVTLFFGVFIGIYSVSDIYDDLVTRTAEGSDAVACHQMWPCCHPRCVGVQFWFIAFAFQVLGLYIALALMLSEK